MQIVVLSEERICGQVRLASQTNHRQLPRVPSDSASTDLVLGSVLRLDSRESKILFVVTFSLKTVPAKNRERRAIME